MARALDKDPIKLVQPASGSKPADDAGTAGVADDEVALDFALEAVSADERRLLAKRRSQTRKRLLAAG